MAEQLISQIDVKENNGTDITGQKEVDYRDRAQEYLDSNKDQLSPKNYQKLEQKIAIFLGNVEGSFYELRQKFEALKNEVLSESRMNQEELIGELPTVTVRKDMATIRFFNEGNVQNFSQIPKISQQESNDNPNNNNNPKLAGLETVTTKPTTTYRQVK